MHPDANDSRSGPYGCGNSSCCILQPCLMQSSICADPPNHHYMPHPRGALENLKLVPMNRTVLGPSEVKVRNNLL